MKNSIDFIHLLCLCQSLTTDPSNLSIEEELLPHNISRMWSRFEAAMQERDMTLQSEVIRLVVILSLLSSDRIAIELPPMRLHR